MIRLESGENIVALTLTEKVTISDPYYLVEFISTQTNQKYYCVCDDTSVYPDRYNLLTITIQSSPTPTDGEVNLVLGDEYEYNVYQQASSSNLNPEDAEGLVETGLMTYGLVIAPRVEHTNSDDTRKAYQH